MILAQSVHWHDIVDFSDYGALLSLSWKSVVAAAVLGLLGGLMSVFVMMRDLPFAVHGVSELSFAGAAGFLLAGGSVVAGSVVGSLVAAYLIGTFGIRARDRNSVIGVLMPFGLGLGFLFLSLYPGRTANKFGLLIGQIAALNSAHLVAVVVTAVVVLAGLLAVWRPLTFASTDPDLAVARGVPLAFLSLAFMLLLGLTVAVCVQAVGALLVLTILCTPAAAAMRVTASPVLVPVLSVAIAVTSMVGGTLLGLGSVQVPITPYVTTISFALYLACRVIGAARERRGWAGRLRPRRGPGSRRVSGRTPRRPGRRNSGSAADRYARYAQARPAARTPPPHHRDAQPGPGRRHPRRPGARRHA